MELDRRRFLAAAAAAAAPGVSAGGSPVPDEPADHVIRIGEADVEVAPGEKVRTTVYNGAFPGPLLRFREGRPVRVDIHNDTDRPEQLHWHGLHLPVDVDGSAEEGTPWIPPRGLRRIAFTPGPPGLRFYHTHVRAGADLSAGQYGGQVGPLYIEPRREPGAYDREVFLVLKEFAPQLSQGGDMDMDFLVPAEVDAALKAQGERAMAASLAGGAPHGYEVGYGLFTINGRRLGHGEPIRVKTGERVLLHVVNASATEIRSLALPGHRFTIVALDGNPAPVPATVDVLWLGTAERVSAIVEMNRPGVWILGDVADDDRANGMGVVVEYAGAMGEPAWLQPPKSGWDYRRFARPGASAPPPDEIIDMIIAKDNAADHGFNRWTINGMAFSDMRMKAMFRLRKGRRYRLRIANASDDIHPLHLHRHSFELTRIAGSRTAGVIKDVVMLGGYQRLELDFVADNPGRTLFHCHQQLHMDFGFMALFDYA